MNEYIMIKRKALPQSLNDVLNAKKLIEDDGYSISEACKETNISRSTYYKYAEQIFEINHHFGKKMHILLKAQNNKGVLGNVLSTIASIGGNVISINQAIPIRDLAYISIMIELPNAETSNEEIIKAIRKVANVKKVEIIAVE